MKGIVIYYSATGNTRKIAKAIYRGMNELTEECDIATIRELNYQDLVSYDLIGLGAPIWGYSEPTNVRTFIYNMPKLEGKLCFPFCVHGAAPKGFMFSIVPALRRKGLTIIGYNDWYGSVYQVRHMPKPYVTDGHPDEIDIEEAENFGREMVERARKIASDETSLILELPKGPEVDMLWQPPGPPVRTEEQGEGRPVRGPLPKPERTINMEKCRHPECTICVDNCMVNSIDFSVTPPIIKENCLNCSFCNRMCPVGAIELDHKGFQWPQRKINMEKCTYPKCTLCMEHCPMEAIDFSVTPPVFKWNCEGDDLCAAICPEGAVEVDDEAHNKVVGIKDTSHPFIKLLKEAEAQGRFRWLVSLDEIGWDNPIHKIKKHPLFVIEED